MEEEEQQRALGLDQGTENIGYQDYSMKTSEHDIYILFALSI